MLFTFRFGLIGTFSYTLRWPLLFHGIFLDGYSKFLWYYPVSKKYDDFNVFLQFKYFLKQ